MLMWDPVHYHSSPEMLLHKAVSVIRYACCRLTWTQLGVRWEGEVRACETAEERTIVHDANVKCYKGDENSSDFCTGSGTVQWT